MTSATTTYQISGMSCGHCEGAVSSEVSSIEDVTEVRADATTGLVTVTTATAEPDDERVREAVDEAGFDLVGRA